jgi:hypothetical protein
MSRSGVDKARLHSICALLEEQGVGGGIIEDFKRSLKESGLLAVAHEKSGNKTFDQVLGAAALKNADDLRDSLLAIPTRRTNPSPSLSPKNLQQHPASSSSAASPNSPLSHYRHADRVSQERGSCFDVAPTAIDYNWVTRKNSERKSRIQKLLSSPRPPTPQEQQRPSRAADDDNFDAFSEHDPRSIQGLNRLYIPPPSPKVSRSSNTSALLNSSVESIYSHQSFFGSSSSPNRAARSAAGSAARSSRSNAASSTADERFDSFPDQDYRKSFTADTRHARPVLHKKM